MFGSKPEIIKELEKTFGTKLKKRKFKYIWDSNGFSVNAQEAVIGLNLSDLNITDLSPLSSLTALTDLNLRFNKVTDLSPLASLTALEKLYLHRNQITDLSPLASLNALERLSLNDNQIIYLSPLASLTALTSLRLSYNQITDLSPLLPLLALKKLKWLHLDNNKITHLPPGIINNCLPIKWEYDVFSSGIFLTGNPLESPPIEIVKRGPDAVIAYFQQLKAASVHLLQCKILIVGNGEVGKTTLMKKLKDPSFQVELGKEETTHGINISPWELNCRFDNENTETVKISFWDFGGQD